MKKELLLLNNKSYLFKRLEKGYDFKGFFAASEY
jgi:hypothetical protein